MASMIYNIDYTFFFLQLKYDINTEAKRKTASADVSNRRTLITV